MSSDGEEEEEEEEKKPVVIDLCSPSPSPPTAKVKADIRRLEETEDCFVLDFDPFEPVIISDEEVDGDDVSIVAEKGEIASRDYPHARYLCPRYPFGTTRHVLHCKTCYCYVCDTAAPCDEWNDHCDATNHYVDNWKSLRDLTISRREQFGVSNSN